MPRGYAVIQQRKMDTMTRTAEQHCPSNVVMHDELCSNVQTFSLENVLIAAIEHLPVPIMIFLIAWTFRREVANLLKRLNKVSGKSKFGGFLFAFEVASDQMAENEGKAKTSRRKKGQKEGDKERKEEKGTKHTKIDLESELLAEVRTNPSIAIMKSWGKLESSMWRVLPQFNPTIGRDPKGIFGSNLILGLWEEKHITAFESTVLKLMLHTRNEIMQDIDNMDDEPSIDQAEKYVKRAISFIDKFHQISKKK